MLDKRTLTKVTDIARRAGEEILRVYESDDFGVETKADDTPLTKADLAANRVIVEGLRALDERTPIVSEENRVSDFETRNKWTYYWLVDPLDGTKEFVKRNGEFTVNIALIRTQTPVAGVVFAPAVGSLYYGSSDGGAWRVKGEGVAERIAVEPKSPGERIIAARSRSHARPEEETFFAHFNVERTITAGSSLKFCLVAEGSAHLYYRSGPTSEWDNGAGDAVLRAAGGSTLSPSGDPLRYNKPDLLVDRFAASSFPVDPKIV